MVAEAHRSCVRQHGRKETIFGPTHSLPLSVHTQKSFFFFFFRDVTFRGAEKKKGGGLSS